MNLQMMISALIERGWSQHSIAEKIGTTQPTIHRAAKGADVRYETGKSIERLFESVVGSVDKPAAGSISGPVGLSVGLEAA